MKLRRFSAFAAVAALSMGMAACGGTDAPADKAAEKPMEVMDVNFGYIPDLNGTALIAIANDQGLWEKHGLNVNLKTFTNGPLQIQALGTKDLDYGYIGNGAFWLPASGKADMACLIATSQADRVIAQPGIKDIKDLKGKKVGVPEGTSGDTILTLALEKAGMTIDDIERVPMDPGTVVSAFSAGQIDAAGLWYPMVDTIKKQVPDLVELAEDKDFEDQLAFPSAIVMRKGLDKENPELAKRVQMVLTEALDFRAENGDKTVELVAALSGQDAEALKGEAKYIATLSTADQLKLWEDGTIENWLNTLGKFFVKNGKVQESELLAPNTYFKIDLLKEAAGK
ncbi:ABC transporter, substrate-binding protein, aliphatic sulfonates family [Gleimia coleocanis DSM 15436]|uniref:ABC transporter, substrate-binding protein, aliphatic sulfonates family n=1 Tax=Gleimia coleocanis DSM 15436 TaxID=525245 RepID=C0VYF5_9ACTO|nr:aliphatic sulfonate ABC transporter substrate-binding protein [Gleimia coleocanis]EEH64458.1 ABC transporter, substrate-binding protein, aliphatic sulfonates family [Gleimia coleocanis DSM 15436]